MIKKNKLNNSLWWLDFCILNNHMFSYNYSHYNNILSLSLHFNFIYFYFLILKNSLHSLYFYIADMTVLKKISNHLFISHQSIFFDIKVLLEIKILTTFVSISSLYQSSTWLEREIKEFTTTNIFNLKDTRKLLTNYNYNQTINYTNYNNITNDLLI